MRSLWITLTLGLTVFLSGETVSFLLGTGVGPEPRREHCGSGRARFRAVRTRFSCNNKRRETLIRLRQAASSMCVTAGAQLWTLLTRFGQISFNRGLKHKTCVLQGVKI